MIDTLRSDYPRDMTRAADDPTMGTLESMANDVLDHLKDYAREHPSGIRTLCARGWLRPRLETEALVMPVSAFPAGWAATPQSVFLLFLIVSYLRSAT